MTSALHRSPSQAKRESRRFEVLVAQRRRLLAALESLADHVYLSQPSAGSPSSKSLDQARAAAAEVRACRVVPLEDPK